LADETILETRGLTKEFKGFVAVKDVSLKVRRGSIHALIGPNGAGKTTCFNLLTHFLEPTRGQIFFKGREITGSPPARIARMGLVRSFQISAVFPHLTVLENVRVALQRKRGASFDFWRSRRILEGPWMTRARADRGGGPQRVRGDRGGRAALRPQARPRDRDHPRARPGDDAARRADRRHDARDVERITALIKKVSATAPC
jgi:ABC-type sugar transport system ATPase subunit